MDLIALAALLIAGRMQIDAQTDCPSGEAVARELDALSSERDASPSTERVEIRRVQSLIRLRLTGANGLLLAERSLPGGNCDELARAAAVLIAAWRTEVAATSPRLELAPPPPPSSLGFEVGAGFTAWLAGSAFASGGTLAASLGPRRGRVLARVALTGSDLRWISVGTKAGAHARFTRAGLSAGPIVRFRPGRFLLDLFAEATAALVYVDAVGFPSNSSAFDFDVGLGGGGRAARRLGPVAPFVGARVVGWLTPQAVKAVGPGGGTTDVPRFDLLFEVGIAIGRY